MELAIRDGDYVPDGVGGLRRATGREEVLQRALFKLTARRGAFPLQENLGSRLWELPKLPAAQRRSAAVQYAAEALEGEPLSVEAVDLVPLADGTLSASVRLLWQGEELRAALSIQ